MARLELTRSLKRCGEWSVLGLVPAVVGAVCCVSFVRRGVSEPDFGAFWLAARAVLHGHSPYAPLASLPSLDELRAKLLGLLVAPATKIAQVVNAPAAKVARVVQAYAAKNDAA